MWGKSYVCNPFEQTFDNGINIFAYTKVYEYNIIGLLNGDPPIIHIGDIDSDGYPDLLMLS